LEDLPAQSSDSRRSRWWITALVIAALIPAVPIVAGLAMTSARVSARTVNPAAFNPVVPAPPAVHRSDGLPPGSGSLVALVVHATTMRVAPGGARLATLTTRTEFRSPEALWVVAHSAKWLGVVSPLAGNGRTGWIPRSAASLTRVPWELKVSLSARQLQVIDNGRVLERYTVAVGRPSAPTPTGRFAVTDRLATNDPSGPYGCCILALSAHSPHAIQGWSGGTRIAIHSTPDTSSIGLPVSHGCVRLTIAEGRWLMNHIPLGTPTIISS
jgi:lipoprotein-anchoring transpeptidase ErfK/SrfK